MLSEKKMCGRDLYGSFKNRIKSQLGSLFNFELSSLCRFSILTPRPTITPHNSVV